MLYVQQRPQREKQSFWKRMWTGSPRNPITLWDVRDSLKTVGVIAQRSTITRTREDSVVTFLFTASLYVGEEPRLHLGNYSSITDALLAVERLVPHGDDGEFTSFKFNSTLSVDTGH